MKAKFYILIIFYGITTASAQITTPVIRANFGVDADLRANYFNGAVNSAADDWYNNGTAGTGQFMIDTTGAAAIVSNYTLNAGSRMVAFSRLMRPAAYSIINNRLVLDAIFHRDFHGTDSTVFASGSNKNGMSPVLWSCPVAQNIPDKNDILDAFTHVRRAGPNVTDSLWMFGGISIQNTTGNRYFDFELYQTDIYYDRTNRVFGGYGTDAGHTSWLFDAAGNVIRAGDIIFSAEYGNSSLTMVEARIWINKSSLSLTPVNFTWGGLFDGDGAAATYGYASIIPKTSGAYYTGLQSATGVWAGPFSLVQQDNSVVTSYAAGQFMEFSVNLTKLGIDPGNFSNNPCGTPFRRVLIKSRASTSFTAELKDFIAPFRMFDYPPVDAFTNLLYFCQTFPPTTIYVINPNPTSIYTWTTANGNIVGPSTGTSIVVNAPGTYKVTQKLHVQCPFYSVDSVTIFFDNVCTVLDVNIINFTAEMDNSKAALKWQATNNKDAASYEIEYSFDGINFLQLASLPANTNADAANYSFTYPLSLTNRYVIYYRIKVNGRNGRVNYSNIISVKNTNTVNTNGTIYPNPTQGELWFSTNIPVKETAEVYIWNAEGKIISCKKINLNTGENIIRIPWLSGKPQGIYLVKIKSANTDITNKVLVLQ